MRDAFTVLRRFVQFGASGLALCLAQTLVGCMTSHVIRLDEWGGAQNCHFAHVTKRNFETALRRVFDASGPKIYGLRPEGGGALVEQHWTLDVVFASATGTERWRLEYAPAGDGVDVHAEVENAPGVTSAPAPNAVQPSGKKANYELLWSRMQYVLARRADWPQCESSKLPRAGLCSTGSSEPPLKIARSR